MTRLAASVGGGIGLLIFAVAVLTSPGDQHPLPAACGLLAAGAFAAGCAYRAAIAARGRQRSAWVVLAAGLSGWALGDAVWVVLVITDAPAATSGWVIGLGYLLLPLCGLAAAVLVPSNSGTRFGLRLLLDGLLITSSLVMIAAIVAHHYENAFHVPWVISTAFTAAYFALALVTAAVGRKAEAGRRWSPSLMALGFLVIGITGAVTGHLDQPHDGLPVTAALGWVAGLYLFSLAALTSRPGPDLKTTNGAAPSDLQQWLPVIPVILAAALGAVYLWPGHRSQIFVFCVGLVMVSAALARQMLLLSHNGRLRRSAWRSNATGLVTRRHLNEHLSARVRLHNEQNLPVSIIILGLRDSAMIKDAVGLPTYEALLAEGSARVLSGALGAQTVARLGEDTLAIVVDDTRERALELAAHIAAAFDEPLHVSDRYVHVHVHFGVAGTSADARGFLTADELLADALSDLRFTRGDSTHLPAAPLVRSRPPTHERSHRGLARIQFIHQLRQAVDNAELTLVYQPKFDLRTQALSGVEALLRWPHEELGVLAPAEFLPLVGELHLLDAVTEIVLARAIGDAAHWRSAGSAIPVAVNMSGPSLTDGSLPGRIAELLDAHHVPAETLTIEITEDLLIVDLDQARDVLRRLRDSGVRVAIDDFGSGYGSMTYLRALPIDDVKIDRPFVTPIVHDRRAAAIVRSMIDLASALDITTTAEGVEDQATADLLARFGCDYVQGNFFSPPLPAAMIRSTHLLEPHRPDGVAGQQ